MLSMSKTLFDYQKKIVDEIWKDIPNYEGLYQVSNLGRVKSLGKMKGWYNSKEKILQPRIKNGYCSVVLYKNNIGVEHRIHRLVAQVFIPNDNNKPFVHHKNHIKTDNNMLNLAWCTNQENQIYAYTEGNSKPTYGFKGKQHTIESKNKISKSLKKYYSKGGGVAYVQEII